MKTNQPKRKNFNNQKMVQSLTPIGMFKLLVRYTDGTSEEMASSKAKQVIRSVE